MFLMTFIQYLMLLVQFMASVDLPPMAAEALQITLYWPILANTFIYIENLWSDKDNY